MTACRNKASRAVTAALVGVLSVGAVPMVALAQTGDGAALMSVEAANAFSEAKPSVTGAFTAEGDGYVANATGSALEVKVGTVTLKNGTSVDVTDKDSYSVSLYAADEDGNPTGDALSAIVDPGNYVVVVEAKKGNYAPGEAKAELTVKAKDFTGVRFRPYEVDPDNPSVMTDTKFMYTGSEIEVGVKSSGSLVEGEDYEVKILKAGTSGDIDSAPEAEVLEPDTYIAYVSGLGAYAGQEAQETFTVDPFDFADAKIEVADVIGTNDAPEHPTKVVSTKTGYEGTELDPSLVNIKCNKVFSANGSYQFTASYDTENKALTGGTDGVISTSVNVNKVGASATFEYDGEAIDGQLVFNKADGEAFDASKLVAYAGDDKVSSSDCILKVTKNGKDVSVSDMTYTGTYEVTYSVDPSKNGYEHGGSVTFSVKVTMGAIDADAHVYFSYKGDIVTSIEKTFDNDAIKLVAGNLEVYAENSDGDKITVKAKLYDSEGKVVSEALNAGTYTLKVTSSQYDLTGTTEMTITIKKIDFSSIKVGALESWSGYEYLPMAGYKYMDGSTEKTFMPNGYGLENLELMYNTGVEAEGEDKTSDGQGWDLISSIMTVDNTYFSVEKYDSEKEEWVEVNAPNRCKEAGLYRVVLQGSSAFAANYTFADDDAKTTTVEFNVVDPTDLRFSDVTPADWFFGSVTEANDAKLMYGYSNGKVFGPNDSISRADVAVILYRMSGKTIDPTLDNGYSENRGWETGYEDVNGNAYYAEAVAWARKAGIVSGYDATHFGPADSVTREQLAAMLQNYARVVSRLDVTADSSSLDKFADAGSVSSFAEGAMSWAVEKGVMGGSDTLRPTSAVSRAETAAMVVNYGAKVAE